MNQEGDEGMSVALWARRLANLFDEMESDGVELSVDGNTVCVRKDGQQGSVWVKE